MIFEPANAGEYRTKIVDTVSLSDRYFLLRMARPRSMPIQASRIRTEESPGQKQKTSFKTASGNWTGWRSAYSPTQKTILSVSMPS